MTRKSLRLWLAPLLLGPACALALEIGEIQVNSSLNQLFDAKIPLPALEAEELGKVSVKLASPAMFKEFGLDRAPALANLVFSIEYNAEGQVYVRIVSTQPIREPSVALLLEFDWPRGKTFREFTVFLDPVRRLAKRPGGRTKTVLDAPAVAVSRPEPEPMPAPKPVQMSEPGPEPEPEPVIAAVTPEPIAVFAEPRIPVEAPPPVKIWKPGDTYGPVAPGEGLWGIALKVRPDPGISRDHMMQALLQANPQAFSKAGISGLKTGAMLRIPAWREIADFTGSPVARRLAEAEQPESPPPSAKAETEVKSPPEPVVAPAQPEAPPEPPAVAMAFPAAPPAVVKSEPGIGPGQPPAVPLAMPPEMVKTETAIEPEPEPALPATPPEMVKSEPEVTNEPEPARVAPEAAQPAPEPVAAVAPAPVLPALEPVMAITAQPEISQPVPSEPAAPISPPEAEMAKPVLLEPMAVATSPELETAEPGEQPVEPASESPAPVLEPVSATPLLFLAVSEMMATIARNPAATLPEPTAPSTAPTAPVIDLLPLEPVGEIATITEVPPEVVAEPAPPVTVAPESPVAVVIEPPAMVPAEPKAESPAVVSAEPKVESPAVIAAGSPVEAPVESVEPPVQPPVSETPQPPAEPAIVESAQPVERVYKGGDQYGPVSANERLWDIAGKVRPDPAIGKDVMMKALFAANPQAFSKPNMNSLKTGVMLRVPGLREIVDSTDSRVAKQLLEQRRAAEAKPVEIPDDPTPSTPSGPVVPPPPPAESSSPVGTPATGGASTAN